MPRESEFTYGSINNWQRGANLDKENSLKYLKPERDCRDRR